MAIDSMIGMDQNENPQPSRGVSRRDFLKIGGGAVLGIGLYEGVRRLTSKESVRPYTAEDVTAHVRASVRRYDTAGHILDSGSTNCIDGRGTDAEVGRAAGDIGDVIEKTAAFERATTAQFSDRELDGIWDQYLASHRGNVYMHTDDHAMHRLAHARHESEEELAEKMASPNGNEEQLLQALTNPTYMGCGHLARMLRHPEEYPGVRPEVVRHFVKKFFRSKWEGNPNMDYTVLHGDHREGAVASVRSTVPVRENTPVMKIQPKVLLPNGRESSVFVLHPDVEDLGEDRWIESALRIVGNRQFHAQRAREVMAETHAAHLGSTAAALAAGKPSFDVLYDPNRLTSEVREQINA